MVQQPDEAQVGYMPQHAMENVAVDKVIAVADVPALIARLLLP